MKLGDMSVRQLVRVCEGQNDTCDNCSLEDTGLCVENEQMLTEIDLNFEVEFPE